MNHCCPKCCHTKSCYTPDCLLKNCCDQINLPLICCRDGMDGIDGVDGITPTFSTTTELVSPDQPFEIIMTRDFDFD